MFEMKFYERQEFIQLNRKWRERLNRKCSGFKDIEDESENLINKDSRLITSYSMDSTLEFFLSLDDFLREAQLPKKHRRALELYAQGVYLKEISVKVGMSYSWVKWIIKHYREAITQKA